MKLKPTQRAAQYAGIAAIIAIPAIVIAQQDLPQRNPPSDNTFAAQTLLRAGDVEQLRDALADAIARINALQANAGVAVVKENLYEVVDESDPVPQNGNGLANVSCADQDDILLGCSCEGREAGVNSLQFDLRRFTHSNRRGNASFCACQGANVGSNVARTLVATAQCLTVP